MPYFPPPSAAAGAAQANAEAYADQLIANLKNNPPAALDTLKELADAIGDDPTFAQHITPRPLAAVDGKVVKWVEADSRLEDATADLDARYRAALILSVMDPPYGANNTGAGDQGPVINQCLADAVALINTGRRVRVLIPAGTYRVVTPITWPACPGLMIEGDGEGATIIQSALPNAVYPAIGVVLGSTITNRAGLLNAVPAADILVNTRTVQLAPGVAAAAKVGDLLILDTTKADPDSAGFFLGAYRVVVAINGDVITIDEPWSYTYTVAGDAPKVIVRVTNTDVVIRRMTINLVKGGGGQGVNLPSAVGGGVFEVTVNGNGTKNEGAAGQSFVGIRVEGVNVRVDRCTARDLFEPVNNSYGYGIQLTGNGITVTRNRLERCKHGITAGDNNRRTSGYIYSDNTATDALLEAHSSCIDVIIANNRITITDDPASGDTNGIWLRAHRTLVIGNTMVGVIFNAGSIAAMKVLECGWDHPVIVGNRTIGCTYGVKANELLAAYVDLVIVGNLLDASAGIGIAADDAHGGTGLVIAGNRINAGSAGISLGIASDALIANNNITYGTLSFGSGINADTGAGAAAVSNRLLITGNICKFGGGVDGTPIRLHNRYNHVIVANNITTGTTAGVKIDELAAADALDVVLTNNIGDMKNLPPGSAAIPASGTHRQGEIVYNTAPAAGGFIGWVCTAAGTPGTWKTFGAISP